MSTLQALGLRQFFRQIRRQVSVLLFFDALIVMLQAQNF